MSPPDPLELRTDRQRLGAQLAELATFSDAPAPAVTRVVYSDTDLAARAWLRERVDELGLERREDALGNLFARWPGLEPELPPVATGSHIDAIPHAGRYDGTVGVLGGLEAIRALQAAGVRPRRSIELILFTSEEPTRFGIGCLGSRAMAGALDPAAIRALRDDDGRDPERVARAAGFGGELAEVRLERGAYRAFVELHIEQGPILERERIDVGVVEAIAAPATLELTFEGEGGHAGAVLMDERRDALTGAAETVGLVEAAARSSGSRDTVATVGTLDVHPGAVNSIPSRVAFTVDCRDVDEARRDRVIDEIARGARTVAERRGLGLELRTLNADPPAACDPAVREALAAAGDREGATARPLVSRAYHDALFMARISPTGMLFIPCRGGVSHRPDEYAGPEAIDRGVRVLARALYALAQD